MGACTIKFVATPGNLPVQLHHPHRNLDEIRRENRYITSTAKKVAVIQTLSHLDLFFVLLRDKYMCRALQYGIGSAIHDAGVAIPHIRHRATFAVHVPEGQGTAGGVLAIVELSLKLS